MTRSAPDKVFTSSSEQALDALKAHDGLVIIDLDETLYLRNSTEDFIDCAQPSLLALVLLTLLELIKPWRWSGGEATRDVWRVGTICIFFPWIHLIWRRRVTNLARKFTNIQLHAEVIRKPINSIIIATAGFQPIVKPLVTALQLDDAQLIAMRASSFSDRRSGKLALVTASIGEINLQQALVITDSIDDFPLLSNCATPLLTQWPKAHYRRALRNVYLPSQYLREVKRPKQRYIWRGIIQEDFAFWVLSTWELSHSHVQTLSGLLLLLLSFWCVYERGYVDNDRIAAQYETAPQLADLATLAAVATPQIQPWIWAIFSGALACSILYPDDVVIMTIRTLQWIIVLLSTYLIFKLYNRATKLNRIWLFPLLQLARNCAFIVLIPVSLIGAMALGSHTLSRWLPYLLYRLSDNKWPALKLQLIRLVFFTVLALLAAMAMGPKILIAPSVLALFLWSLFRARHELLDTMRNAARLDNQP